MSQLTINKRTVKVLMAAKGIDSNEELAKLAGFSGQTMRNLLDGGEFRSSTLKALADALEVNPLDLLEIDGYPAPHMDAPAVASVS